MIHSIRAAGAAVVLAGTLAGCSEPSAASNDADAGAVVAESAPATEASATPSASGSATAEAGWSGLHDAATQAKLKAQVDNK